MSDLQHWLGADILSLGMAADHARRAKTHGSVATYLRVHIVNAADLGQNGMIPEAASEVRLHQTPASLDDAVTLLRALREQAGNRRISAFSMADLEERSASGWGDLAGVLRTLVRAGLTDVAELPVDQLADLEHSVRALVDAGASPRRVTVAHPVGDRTLDVLERVQVACAAARGALYFSPLPRRAPVDKPTTGYEDLRMVALARLAVEQIPNAAAAHIEVDWSLYGPKLAQVALTFGADHLDAVSATSDAALGPRRATVEDVERNIRAAGFEPQEYRPIA